MSSDGEISHRRLGYFVALVEQRSFAGAAARCGISQSALSQQLVKLEREIGGVLVDRSVRPFDLTPLGHEVYGRALAIGESYREIANAVRKSAAGKVGRVRIGIVPTLLYLGDIPAALCRFRADFPDVQVDLRRMDNAVAISQLLDRHLDVVFSFSPIEGPDLEGVTLWEEDFVAALPAGHPLAGSETIDISALRHEEFITFPREAYADSQDDLIHAARQLGFSPIVRNVHATFIEHTGFVAAGFGVALVPRSLAAYPLNGVTFVPVAGSELRLVARLFWRAEATDPSIWQFAKSVSASLGVDHGAVPMPSPATVPGPENILSPANALTAKNPQPHPADD